MTATIDSAVTADSTNFRTVLSYILPNPEEYGWLRIPWHTDLWEARRPAASEGKPIFLWGMNGNPLGLT